ncbi:MAG TPA: molybdopterin biosynthesis protein [Methylomirabilota bacterium]|jgi:putative molybdopterin biosynthesis protein|nr:molybdopterin biosynthesis protein [Methylomirabilota bacterium]
MHARHVTEHKQSERKRYLKKKSLAEALSVFLNAVTPPKRMEMIAVERALHRTTAEPIFAVLSAPHYHGSAMDGIAVRAEDTFGASEFSAVTLRAVPVENGAPYENGRGVFQYVDTGNPLPAWANAVVMIERVFKKNDQEVEIREAATPWQHVRLVGEDIVATEPLLPRGHKLRPYDIGALLAAGHVQVPVVARPTVGIIPTGSELIEPGEPPQPGRIIEFNSRVTAAFVEEWGGEPHRLPRVTDELPKISKALTKAVQTHDIVVIIAGSSAGEHDFTVRALEALGEVLVHGIDVMPGKPAILAVIDGKPVIGLPGYPVSAVVICQQILRPLLARFLGRPAEEPQKITAVLPRKIPSRLGLEEFVRVSLGRVKDRVIVNPLNRGAGVITTMVKADGVLRIPPLEEGVNAGQEVEVELLRPVEEIANTILFTGSNDLTIGVLDDQLRAQYPELRISASNIGSLGGLMALKREEAHVIGTHLLDPATGQYNLPDLKRQKLLSQVVVMNLVIREQGLIVPKGNPKKIKGLKDLARKDITFINRQPGAGTRILLDYKLEKLKIAPQQIKGYEREEVTHMAVAVAVASGLADTGLGVKSAAKALGLDFIPVEREEYDLVFLKDFFNSDMGQKLVAVIRSDAFKRAVEALDGYDTKKTGTIKKAERAPAPS